MAISQSVIAEGFTFESPEQVEVGREFSINLDSNSEEEHDVKAFVSQDIKEYSEIFWDEKWKSTHYYLISSFPQEDSYKLRANQPGETNICVRLRKTGSTSYTETCNEIEVIESEISDEKDVELSNNKEETSNSNDSSFQNKREVTSQKEIKEAKVISEEKSNEPLVLNFVSQEKAKENTVLITKTGKVRNWTIYSFIVFLVLIISFLALRKI